MSWRVRSRVGMSIQPMMFSGAPAATAASSTTLAAAMVDFAALWCGLRIMPFLVLRAMRHLKMAVEVGFVVGMMAQMIPTGSAIFLTPNWRSSSIMPQVLTSL